jgi:hypothetical protein
MPGEAGREKPAAAKRRTHIPTVAGGDHLAAILAGVKAVLRARGIVSLPDQGIDLLFDGGVVARCRTCRVAWEVKRTQYSAPGWWACPSGCRRPGSA